MGTGCITWPFIKKKKETEVFERKMIECIKTKERQWRWRNNNTYLRIPRRIDTKDAEGWDTQKDSGKKTFKKKFFSDF